MSGFEFSETMQGTWRRGEEERALRFTIRARSAGGLQFLKDFRAHIEGHVDANGLATHAPLTGEMVINPVLGRVIRYEFTFTGDDGKTYRFAGQKDISPQHLVRSLTTLPAELTDAQGTPVGSALLSFDVRDLPSFLGSFRPVL